MRETIDISLNGIAFKAEYDAYEILKDYFDRLRSACSVEGDEGKEIADDIEARAAELILSRNSSIDMPIDSKCAQWVIEQLGGVDQIPLSDNRNDDYYGASDRNEKIGYIPKRFYRSKEGARVGGIFSGLGLYFNVDPSILRLSFAVIMLALLFFGRYSGFFSGVFFFSLLIYLMACILVPVAVTPRQKLELNGQPVTPDTIRRSFRSGLGDVGDRTDGVASVMTRIVYIFGKVIMFMVYSIVIMISVSLAIGIITVLAGGYGAMIYFYDMLSVFVDAPVYFLGTVAIMSVVAPLGLLLYLFVSILAGKSMRSYITVPLILIWVLSWILCGVFGFKERMRYLREAKVETAFSLAQPAGDTLYVRAVADSEISYEYLDGNGFPVYTQIIGYETSDSPDYSISIERRSYGRSQTEAHKCAEQIDLGIFQQGDTVFVDYGQFYNLPSSFRSQIARVYIKVPEGKDLIIDNKFIMEGGVYRRRANRTAVPATPTVPADNDEDDVATDGEKREVIVLDHEKE